ncbi:MAG: hypothetical protein HYZ45_06300 [Burkholderiales bacterium]|nr:hypothetical protein [Burkholderiales bacterium]
MMIKLVLLLLVVMTLVVAGLVTVMISRRRAMRRAGQVRMLRKAEWSSTVYGCAESRAEF